MDLSIVIPVYNNASSLRELVDRIRQTLSSFEFEIVLVNDCSRDNSLDIIKELSLKYDCVKYLDHTINLGQHRTTLDGIEKAEGTKIAVLDADLQDRPELIIELWKKSHDEFKAVFVKRIGLYQSKGRMITSTFMKRAVQLLSGLHYKAGSYYMFDSSIKGNVVSVGNKCNYPYMSIIVASLGGAPGYIESARAKNTGPSGYSFKKRLKAAAMAIYCALYCRYVKWSLD